MSTPAWARFRSFSSALRRGWRRGSSGIAREFARGLLTLKAGRAEEDDGVLNLFAAETGQGFLIFGQDAEDAAIGAVEERFVLVGDRRGFEMSVIGQVFRASSMIQSFLILFRARNSAARIAGYQNSFIVVRGSAAPPRNRSRYRAGRGRCKCPRKNPLETTERRAGNESSR